MFGVWSSGLSVQDFRPNLGLGSRHQAFCLATFQRIFPSSKYESIHELPYGPTKISVSMFVWGKAYACSPLKTCRHGIFFHDKVEVSQSGGLCMGVLVKQHHFQETFVWPVPYTFPHPDQPRRYAGM